MPTLTPPQLMAALVLSNAHEQDLALDSEFAPGWGHRPGSTDPVAPLTSLQKLRREIVDAFAFNGMHECLVPAQIAAKAVVCRLGIFEAVQTSCYLGTLTGQEALRGDSLFLISSAQLERSTPPDGTHGLPNHPQPELPSLLAMPSNLRALALGVLACHYTLDGRVGRQPQLAATYYQEAAELDLPEVCYNAGLFFEGRIPGTGPLADHGRARRYYRRALELGLPAARGRLEQLAGGPMLAPQPAPGSANHPITTTGTDWATAPAFAISPWQPNHRARV